MKNRIHDFKSFISLNESKSDGTSIVIGDSCTPNIFRRSKTLTMLGTTGSEENLWKSGMGVKWLNGAVSKHPVDTKVKDVVINIGTNGGFSTNDDIKGLVSGLRRVFPQAKLSVVQGSWGWGGNISVTAGKVKQYYDRFKTEGVTVIEPPIGKVTNPHVNLPVYDTIAKEIDGLVTNQSGYIAPTDLSKGNSTTSQIISRPKDPYKYKVEGDHWLAKKDSQSRWYELTGADFNPAYQISIDTLDSENPNMRSKNAPKKSGADANNTSQIVNNQSPIPNNNIIFTPAGVGTNPEQDDAAISREYNFHLIPDGKGTNYRSAQFPLEVMKQMYPKYGIKNVIRFNGDGKDGRHQKKDQSVSIAEEEALCKQLGCKFYKLSSTRDQDKVNEIIKSGNTLVHCAHGADRTGGNVGGYLYTERPNGSIATTDQIWKYTTNYNGWNSMALNRPRSFADGYLQQSQKFGVRDLNHAQELARKYKQ